MPTLPADSFQKSPQELAAYNAACPPTGSYYARIFKFVYMGTIKRVFPGKDPEWKPTFRISMEIVSHPRFIFDKEKGMQPWTCSVESTYSTSSQSNLYKWIKNIYKNDPNVMLQVSNGQFEIGNLLNKLVTIDVIQKIAEKNKQANLNVTNITSPFTIAGFDISTYHTMPLANELVVFDIGAFLRGDLNMAEQFKKLYKFEKKNITESQEFAASGLNASTFLEKNVPQSQGTVPYQQQPTVPGMPPQNYPQQPQQGFYQPPSTPKGEPDDLPF